ncbi:hypothetical protein V8C86DRAFT_1518113 [Haematococcus lacustris]
MGLAGGMTTEAEALEPPGSLSQCLSLCLCLCQRPPLPPIPPPHPPLPPARLPMLPPTAPHRLPPRPPRPPRPPPHLLLVHQQPAHQAKAARLSPSNQGPPRLPDPPLLQTPPHAQAAKAPPLLHPPDHQEGEGLSDRHLLPGNSPPSLKGVLPARRVKPLSKHGQQQASHAKSVHKLSQLQGQRLLKPSLHHGNRLLQTRSSARTARTAKDGAAEATGPKTRLGLPSQGLPWHVAICVCFHPFRLVG